MTKRKAAISASGTVRLSVHDLVLPETKQPFSPYIRNFDCEACGCHTCQQHRSEHDRRETKCRGCARVYGSYNDAEAMWDATKPPAKS